MSSLTRTISRDILRKRLKKILKSNLINLQKVQSANKSPLTFRDKLKAKIKNFIEKVKSWVA